MVSGSKSQDEDAKSNSGELNPLDMTIQPHEELEDDSEEKIKKFISDALDHVIYTIFICIVTLYALLGDDIRVCIFGKGADIYFYIITIFCFVIFIIEFLLTCYSKSDFMFSFFFFLDIISTLSLLFDIGWITDLIFSTNSSDEAGTSSQNAAQLAKAAQASKIGTRAARVIRIVRLIRLIRIIKLYKAIQQQRELHYREVEKVKKENTKHTGNRRMVIKYPLGF